MNAETYYSEIREITKKRERLLNEAGHDFSLVGSDKNFKGFANDDESYIMIAANASVQPGNFIESRGRKYFVSEVVERPGALIVKSDAVKAEYPLYESVTTSGGTTLKPTRGILKVFEQSGTSLTVSRAQALSSVGLVVKIGGTYAEIKKATSVQEYHLGKLEVQRIDPQQSAIRPKYAEMPDHLKGAPGVLPVRGKAF